MPINEAERRALEGMTAEKSRFRGMLGRTYQATGTQRDPRGEVDAMAGGEAKYFQAQMDRLRQNYSLARMRQKLQRFQMDQAIREQRRQRKAATRSAVLGGASALTQILGRRQERPEPQRYAPAGRDAYSHVFESPSPMRSQYRFPS